MKYELPFRKEVGRGIKIYLLGKSSPSLKNMNATHSLPFPFHFPADNNNDEKARHLMFHFYPV
jgi:hypothetical protein